MALPYKLLFAGTDSFAVPSLQHLARIFPRQIVGVITQPDRPRGRGQLVQPSAIAQTAAELDLPVFKPADRSELTDHVRQCAPDVAIVVAYGKLIPPDLLAAVPYGWLNVHPSLLPHYRGPTPIESALLAGDTETGVSFMLLDAEMDHGPIVQQIVHTLTGQETAGELSAILANKASVALPEILERYCAGTLKPQPQQHGQATFTPLLRREDGLLQWSQETAGQIERKIRAYAPWPGTFCLLPNGQRLKILRGEVYEKNMAVPEQPGPHCSKDGLLFRCADGSLLRAHEVQREGKAPISGVAFCAGHRSQSN